MESEAIIISIILVVITVIALSGAVSVLIDRKKAADSFDWESIEEAEPVTQTARVVSKRTEMKQTGSIREPSHALLFLVTFEKENGEVVEYPVSQEIYENCNTFSSGTLMTVDEEFFDFK